MPEPGSWEEFVRSHTKLQHYRAADGLLWDGGRIQAAFGLRTADWHKLLKLQGLSMHEIASPGSPRHQECLAQMVGALVLELVLKPGDFKRWLRKPNAEFSRMRPLALLLSRPDGLELLGNLAHDVLTGQPG